ncbi:MAG: gamma-glutamyltransferase family protein [SAR324 cluster bacterium]|nr:gamma-glutamyltransferase family protein [SAR324 cluster bacterium]
MPAGYDFLNSKFERARPSLRPVVRGTTAMVSSGHQFATRAAVRILERGGNAIDAGVAAGICLGVLHSDMVNFGGVAPIIVYHAAKGSVKTVSGLGRWPKRATVEYFKKNHNGELPSGTQTSVIPAAPDAWITALRHFGTMSFEDVSADAIQYAEHGFPMHQFMANNLQEEAHLLNAWKSTREIYMPKGRTPMAGEVFVQRDLADTMKRMAAAERKHRFSGRDAALQAARDEFYEGGIAEAIVDFQKKNDGLIAREDLAAYHSTVENAPSVSYGNYQMYACGAWCQGPAMLEALNLLEGFDLKGLGHNSPGYVHTLVEAFKLAFADREAYIADPEFVNVPMKGLLSKTFAKTRRQLIDPHRAWTEMPPAGDPWNFQRSGGRARGGSRGTAKLSAAGGAVRHERWDTSYVAVMDQWGNAFSATPSDAPFNTPIVPGLGIICSGRGSQSWIDEQHPSSIAPGKRPRLTPAPGLVMKGGKPYMAFGTPGGDVQIQSMLQVFFNIVEFGMDPQEAVEAPRFCTHNFPGSFYPHDYHKGLLMMESRMGPDLHAAMSEMGNEVRPWADYSWRGGGVCTVVLDEREGVLLGAADPRREAYAYGW